MNLRENRQCRLETRSTYESRPANREAPIQACKEIPQMSRALRAPHQNPRPRSMRALRDLESMRREFAAGSRPYERSEPIATVASTPAPACLHVLEQPRSGLRARAECCRDASSPRFAAHLLMGPTPLNAGLVAANGGILPAL